MQPSDLTFVLIAQNEEQVLDDALKSCEGLGSILVIDGGSEDSTVSLAEARGAKVIVNPFRYASAQYNFGLDNVTTPWAFILDADERLGDRLRQAIRDVEPGDDDSAYWTERRNYFMGGPIKHSGWTPDSNVRLMRVSKARYDDRPVHARVVVDSGKLGDLAGLIHHITYRTVHQYVRKLNNFTQLELASRKQVQRVLDGRSRLRRIYLSLPFKSGVRFFYMYVVKAGFLDGRRGFDLARLSAIYETVVSMKQRYEGQELPGADVHFD